MSEIVVKSEMEIERLSDIEFLEKIDVIFDAFLNNKKMMSLNDRDYNFARDLLNAHHILVSPDIAYAKELPLIQKICNCSETKAIRIRKAHILLWGDAKGVNDDFKKRLIADKVLKFAEEAEEEGDNDKATELYEKYYKMRGFDKMEVNKTPRSLPKLIVLDNDPRLLEIEDAIIDE